MDVQTKVGNPTVLDFQPRKSLEGPLEVKIDVKRKTHSSEVQNKLSQNHCHLFPSFFNGCFKPTRKKNDPTHVVHLGVAANTKASQRDEDEQKIKNEIQTFAVNEGKKISVIMKNKKIFTHFLNFVEQDPEKREACHVHFLFAVDEYRELFVNDEKSLADQVIQKKAIEIFEKYIEAVKECKVGFDAYYQKDFSKTKAMLVGDEKINIGDSIRQGIQRSIEEKRMTKDLFDNAKEQILSECLLNVPKNFFEYYEA